MIEISEDESFFFGESQKKIDYVDTSLNLEGILSSAYASVICNQGTPQGLTAMYSVFTEELAVPLGL